MRRYAINRVRFGENLHKRMYKGNLLLITYGLLGDLIS